MVANLNDGRIANADLTTCIVTPPLPLLAQESLFVALASVSLFAADGVMVVYGELMVYVSISISISIYTLI